MRSSAVACFASCLLTVAAASSAIAQPPVSKNVELRSRIDVYNGLNDCWGYRSPGGTELAIYGHTTGTSFVDATDPSNPTEVVNLPGATSIWRDMFTYSHYCYIVTEGGGPGTGLQIVDLADPQNPVLVTTYTGNGFTTAHNIFIDVAAGVAYAVGAAPAGGTRILSLANPTSPVELDYFTPYYIHDMFVADGVGYAGAINSGTLRIIDLSDPANPSTMATHFYPNSFTHNAWPNAARTHCATTDENGGGHLRIWDVSDLGGIELASEYELPGHIVHDVRIEDDVVYLSYYTAGARIVDLVDPMLPVEIGYYDTSLLVGGFNGNWGVYPFRGDGIFYATDRQRGLHILEFTGTRAGFLAGVVRDAATNAPIDGATVTIEEEGTHATTAANGAYRFGFPAAAVTVVTKRFGYAPSLVPMAVPEGVTTTHDVNLVPLPFGSVKLTVAAAESGAPIAGLIATVLDSPLAPSTTNASGEVVLAGLPAGIPWSVRLAKFGREVGTVVVFAPPNAEGTAAASLSRAFFDDFEVDQAWIAGAPGDGAVDGIWEREIPIGSFFEGVVGANVDASPTGEGYAFVTDNHNPGAAASTSDVDGGRTTLLSPVFDGTGLGELTLSYSRWYSNRAPAPSSDTFRCDVSMNGGAAWTNLESVSTGTDSWAAVSLPLSSLVTPTAAMQLRFVAEDLGDDTYVEAGIDDVAILSSATGAPVVTSAPGAQRLAAPAPSPFRDATTISFDVARTGRAALEILDVTGRRVVRLLDGDRVAAGTHRVRWDGRDERGARVSPGIYFVRLTGAQGTETRKVSVLR